MEPESNQTWILPVGTRVVTRTALQRPHGGELLPAGAIGVVVKAPIDPLHAYRVKFPDGLEVALTRRAIELFTHFQGGALRHATPAGENLLDYVIYRCITGSRAYGLDNDGSDTDRRGIYLPPADMQWSLYGVAEQIENHEAQECYWELQKFLTLALKANPNVLECLYTPLVEHATPLAHELLAMRDIFISKLVYQTYNGYVLSQFKKMEADLRNRGAIKWKHAMHLIRLLLAGVTVLTEGVVPVRVDAHRDRLLAIRRGEVAFDDVNAWRLELHHAFETAYATTMLPPQPDYEKANTFLIKARRSMVPS